MNKEKSRRQKYPRDSGRIIPLENLLFEAEIFLVDEVNGRRLDHVPRTALEDEGNIFRLRGSAFLEMLPEETELETLQAPVVAARQVVARRQKALTEMRADPQHYGVEFYEVV